MKSVTSDILISGKYTIISSAFFIPADAPAVDMNNQLADIADQMELMPLSLGLNGFFTIQKIKMCVSSPGGSRVYMKAFCIFNPTL